MAITRNRRGTGKDEEFKVSDTSLFRYCDYRIPPRQPSARRGGMNIPTFRLASAIWNLLFISPLVPLPWNL